MKNFLKIFQCFFVTALLFCSPHIVEAAPSFAGEANIYLMGEYFDWKEFGNNNQRFVRETGPRFGIGGSYNFEFINHQLIVKPKLEISGGQVDYDGSTNTNVPLKTDTNYFGGKIELDLGWRFGTLQRVSIEPFGGLGIRGWSREIESATASNGTRAQGYTEEWYTAYARAGLRGTIAFRDKLWLFVEAGGKFPFYTSNTAHFDEEDLGPDVTLKPRNRTSWFAEAGMRYKYFKASVYYESMRFGQSDVVYSEGTGYYQPKSQAEMIGMRLGWSF